VGEALLDLRCRLDRGGRHRARGFRQPAHRRLLDRVDVDRVVKRGAHSLVLERVLALHVRVEELVASLVHADEHDALLEALDHPDAGVCEPRHVLRRRIVDQSTLPATAPRASRRW
jgi:hypothetical protein